MHSQQIQKQNKKGLLIRRYLENKRIEKVTIRNKKPQHILKILKKRFKIEKDHFLNVGETIFNLFFFSKFNRSISNTAFPYRSLKT